MSNDSLLPKLSRCPECNTRLHDIVYGLLAQPLQSNQVVGGCEWSDAAPTKTCPKCNWQGGLGGRSWPTKGSQQVPVEDPKAEFGMRLENIDFDLATSSSEELYQLGLRNLNARFELLHRGLDAETIDAFYDQFDAGDAHSWPLVRKQACFIFYNSETKHIAQACIYSAQRSIHEFLYLRPGMDDWSVVESVQEFHDVVFGMKTPDLQVWDVELFDGDLVDEDADSEPFNYGSDSIKAMLNRAQVTQDDLYKEGDQYDRPIYWPHWFNEGTMVNNVLNPWLPR